MVELIFIGRNSIIKYESIFTNSGSKTDIAVGSDITFINFEGLT